MSIAVNPTQEQERKPAATIGEESSSQGIGERMVSRRMKLGDVLHGVEANLPSRICDLEVRQVACDSRKVQPRALFFALHGAKADGNAFIRDAVSRGAVAIISEETAPPAIPSSVTWIQVRDGRKALAVSAANFYGHPAEALRMVA